MASNGGRTGANWLACVLYVKRTQTHCWICGHPVDKQLSGKHPLGPHIHHEPPMASVGMTHHAQHFAIHGLDGLKLTHNRCNLEQGTKPHGHQEDRHRAPGRPPDRTSRNW